MTTLNQNTLPNQKPFPIDAVITWVNGNDPAWREEKSKYMRLEHPELAEASAFTSNTRYRDWDNLQYLFRGIEKHMPWIRTVHLVTWGHLPAWINPDCPKLHIVRHTDFIPAEFLPTFNTNAIELNLHRIPGLAEHFVYFNDDTFAIGDTTPENFFMHGLPRDTAVLSPYPIRPNGIASIETNNLEIINKYFTTADVLRNRSKWFNTAYGKKVFRTAIFSRYSFIVGVMELHLPLAFCKSAFEEVWRKEPALLKETCSHRFRSRLDVSDWLVRQWQLFSGNFEPRNPGIGEAVFLPAGLTRAADLIAHPGDVKLLCVNDGPNATDFEHMKQIVNRAFQIRYPNKSAFEI